jgi:hypothetical protein
VLGALAVRAALLLGLTVAIFLPFWFWDGPRCLGFFAFHRDRGLEIESLYSSLVLTFQGFGGPPEVYHSHNSFNIRSSLSPALLAAAPWVAGAVLLAATVLLLAHAGKLLARPAPKEEQARAIFAQAHPGFVTAYAALFLLLFVAANKVFSPQYLVWLLPFVCLLPVEGRRLGLFLGGFVFLALLTMLLFPILFFSDLVNRTAGPDGSVILQGPTPLGASLLSVRNLLVVGLAVLLARELIQLAREGRDCAPPFPQEEKKEA